MFTLVQCQLGQKSNWSVEELTLRLSARGNDSLIFANKDDNYTVNHHHLNLYLVIDCEAHLKLHEEVKRPQKFQVCASQNRHCQ